jgi:hypothetical protein
MRSGEKAQPLSVTINGGIFKKGIQGSAFNYYTIVTDSILPNFVDFVPNTAGLDLPI